MRVGTSLRNEYRVIHIPNWDRRERKTYVVLDKFLLAYFIGNLLAAQNTTFRLLIYLPINTAINIYDDIKMGDGELVPRLYFLFNDFNRYVTTYLQIGSTCK